MTNEEKLEYIRKNYITARMYELLNEGKEIFYEEWIDTISRILPSRLYKYRKCNNNNLRTLKNRKAWFSKPSTWNDKIDVTVTYNLEKDLEYIEEHFDDYVVSFAFVFINKYIGSFCQQKGNVNSEKVKEVYHSVFAGEKELNSNKMIAYLEPVVGWKPARQIAVKTQEALAMVMTDKFKFQILDSLKKALSFNDIRDKMLMYSLSETYNNGHQWAIYADEGKGFCIGYLVKPKNKKEESLLTSLLPIYYGDREEFSLSKMLYETLKYSVTSEMLQDLINQETEKLFISFLTKAPEWSGEQEWRFSINTNQSNSNLVEFDFAEAIYLGESISEYWKKRLIKIAKEQKLSVYQRKLDSLRSKWIYEKIEI